MIGKHLFARRTWQVNAVRKDFAFFTALEGTVGVRQVGPETV